MRIHIHSKNNRVHTEAFATKSSNIKWTLNAPVFPALSMRFIWAVCYTESRDLRSHEYKCAYTCNFLFSTGICISDVRIFSGLWPCCKWAGVLAVYAWAEWLKTVKKHFRTVNDCVRTSVNIAACVPALEPLRALLRILSSSGFKNCRK